MQNKLIIFDYDGVIVDSLNINLEIAKQACQAINHPIIPVRADIENLENLSFQDLGQQIGLPEDKVGEFTEQAFELLTKNTTPPMVFSGMKKVIQELGKENYIVIITTNIKYAVTQVLEDNGLLGPINLIVGSEQYGSKSEKIRRTMDEFEVKPNVTYMIGDALSDIREARKAGVKSIAVSWGFHSKEKLKHALPDFLVNTPYDIISIFNTGNDGLQ